MRKSILTLLAVLTLVICTSIVYGFTLKGTIYVYYPNGTSKLLSEVVKPSVLKSLKVVVKPLISGGSPSIVSISPNSTFVITLEPNTAYRFYLANATGGMVTLYKYAFGVLEPAVIRPPPYAANGTWNFYVKSEDLAKIVPRALPNITCRLTTPMPTITYVDSNITVGVECSNVGKASGTITVSISVSPASGVVIAPSASQKVTLAPGETKVVNFTITFKVAGTYTLKILQNSKVMYGPVTVTVKSAPPHITCTVTKALPNLMVVDKTYNVTVVCKNVGKSAGSTTILAYVDSSEVFAKTVTVEAGKSITVTVPIKISEIGYHTVTVRNKTTVIYTAKVFVGTAKPSYKCVSTTIPTVIYAYVPSNVCVKVRDISIQTITLVISVVGYINTTPVISQSKTVTLNPGEVKEICIPVTFNVSGTGKIVIKINGTKVKEQSITVKVAPLLIIGEGKTYKVYLDQTFTMPVELKYIKGYAGLQLVIAYNSSVIKLVNTTATEEAIKKAMKTCFPQSMFVMVNAKTPGKIAIGVAGSTPTTISVCRFSITFRAVSYGTTKISAVKSQVTTPNGTLVNLAVIPATIIVTKRPPKMPHTVVVKFVAPSEAYVNVPFDVGVVLMNNGTAPGTVNVYIAYSGTPCTPTVTATVGVGEVWKHEFKCVISTAGTYELQLVVNGTVMASRSIVVKKIPPIMASIKLIPKMYVYWAGYPVMVSINVTTHVNLPSLNVTVVMYQPPLKPEIVISRLIPSPVPGKVYVIAERVILPTFTTRGELVVYVNGIRLAEIPFMTTGVAIVVKPYTYELISVPILPESPVPEIPSPPPSGSAPIKLPTLAQVYSLAFDAVTGEKVPYAWSLVQVYYYNTAAKSAPYYIPWNPTSAPVRPGMGFVVYSPYPDTLVFVIPINITKLGVRGVMALIHYSLAVAYIPFPAKAGWMIAGPIGITPIKLLPSKFENVTLYYTESKTASKWTTVVPVSVGDYVIPGKGYWIFWSIATYHAIHSNMKAYLMQIHREVVSLFAK